MFPCRELMSPIVAISLAATLGCAHSAQAQTARDNLKQQLRAYTDAFIQQDFERLVSIMSPKLIETLGGREPALAFHRQIIASLEQQHLTFKTITLGEPTEVVSEGSESFAIIPTTLQLSNKNEPAILRDYLVAISTDGGSQWSFIAGSDTVAGILRSYPKVSYALSIPRRSLVMNPQSPADFRLEFSHQGGRWVPTLETTQKLQRLRQNASFLPFPPQSPQNPYYDRKHNFSIDFPHGWQIKESSNPATIIKAAFHDANGNFAYIAIAAYPWPAGGNLKADEMFIALKAQFPDVEFKRIDSGETKVRSNTAVFNTIAIQTPPQAASISKHYNINKDGKLFRITAATNYALSFFEEQLPIMENCIFTFAFGL